MKPATSAGLKIRAELLRALRHVPDTSYEYLTANQIGWRAKLNERHTHQAARRHVQNQKN